MSSQHNDEEISQMLIESEDEDIFNDVDDLLSSEESSSDESSSDEEEINSPASKKTKFDKRMWTKGSFSPTLHSFDSSASGINPSVNITNESTELEYFQLFFSDSVMGMIVEETNRYADQLVSSSKMEKWAKTSLEEMQIFIMTILLMGSVGKNNMKQYWTTNPIVETPFFRTLFSRDRFFGILRALHFVNNNNPVTNKLFKIDPLLSLLRRSFKNTFIPFQKLCIDESLVLWKGRLAFKIYIPSKRHRFGIKMFVFCDVFTGYVLDIIIYTGSETDIIMNPDIGISGSIVTTMMRDYLKKGHQLYVDNWYSSPTLFDFLFESGTNACGTARTNRKNMPEFEKTKMKKGDVEYYRSGSLMSVKWKDKREVVMLTNMHESKMEMSQKINYVTGQYKEKPAVVIDYSKNMGAVDKVDRILGFVESSRKTLKWYKKIFFRLLDTAVMNAFFLYKHKTGKKPAFGEFRLTVIKQAIEKYGLQRVSSSGGRRISDHPLRLTGRHFPKAVPQTAAQGNKTQRQCQVCRHSTNNVGKRKETRFMCVECNVALCVVPCFEEYHTKKQY